MRARQRQRRTDRLAHRGRARRGGLNRLDTVEDALADGFECVAMARALLRDPHLIKRFREGAATEGLCVHCMKCTPTVYTGTYCVVRERIEAAPAR